MLHLWQELSQNTISNTFSEWQRLKALVGSCFLYSNSSVIKKLRVFKWMKISGNLGALTCALCFTSRETLLELQSCFPCQVYCRFKIRDLWVVQPKQILKITSIAIFTVIIIVTTFGVQCSMTLRATLSRQVETFCSDGKCSLSVLSCTLLGSFHHFCRKVVENYVAKVSLSSIMPSAKIMKPRCLYVLSCHQRRMY